MATTQRVFVAEHHGIQGDAYALNTLHYRFRPAVVSGNAAWQTVETGLNLWAETGRELLIEDPLAPTRSEQLAMLEETRTR